MNIENDNLEFNDKFIESIVRKADRKILSEDFDSQLMNTLKNRLAYKKEITTTLKKSMLYCFAGILLIGVYALIVILDKSTINSSTSIVSILTLFFIVIVSVVFIDNYKRIFQSLEL